LDLGAIIGAGWELILLNPLINILIVLTKYLFGNLGLTIIVLTIIIRAAMYPLTKSQLMSAKKMQEVQPKLAELQKKYAKDKQKIAKEQMALYKEAGISPLGCLVPMLTQMPIWMALYQSIVRVLATGPDELLNLSRHLYSSWTLVFNQVPLHSQFLWFDLGSPDRLMILPILVGVTMWLQQKMSTPEYADQQQQANSQMMLWMMPIMFTFVSFSFPSGLALYWLTSNIIGIVMQYYVSGWGALANTLRFLKKAPDSKTGKPVIEMKQIPPKKNSGRVSTEKTVPTTEKRKRSWMFWK
jgi:YidC/Oxa1 family membrane protein insertase